MKRINFLSDFDFRVSCISDIGEFIINMTTQCACHTPFKSIFDLQSTLYLNFKDLLYSIPNRFKKIVWSLKQRSKDKHR